MQPPSALVSGSPEFPQPNPRAKDDSSRFSAFKTPLLQPAGAAVQQEAKLPALGKPWCWKVLTASLLIIVVSGLILLAAGYLVAEKLSGEFQEHSCRLGNLEVRSVPYSLTPGISCWVDLEISKPCDANCHGTSFEHVGWTVVTFENPKEFLSSRSTCSAQAKLLPDEFRCFVEPKLEAVLIQPSAVAPWEVESLLAARYSWVVLIWLSAWPLLCLMLLPSAGRKCIPSNQLVYGFNLAVCTFRWLQFGLAACWLSFRLIVYALMLLPAFLRILSTYCRDPRIHRCIRYGPAEREYLDIYVPKEAMEKGAKVPVAIAIMGGGFIIGHRGYNAQLGLRLMEFGIITVGVDYRNFPRGSIQDMVEDVGRGVRWVFENIERYGGDTSNVMLLGQSAGAHLAAMQLLEHSLSEAKSMAEGKEVDNWSVKDLKAFLGICGPYHLEKLGPHLSSRGLYPGIMAHMTGNDLDGCSPEAFVQSKEWKAVGSTAAGLLPPMHLFHGDRDKAVPVWSSEQFAEALKEAGAKVILDVRKGMTHTYPVVEGPMRRHDPQVELVLPMLLGPGAEKRITNQVPLPPMAPLCILDVAGMVSPF